MATSIEHALPTDLVMQDGSLFGLFRPGNVVTAYETGNYRSRSYFEYNLQQYGLRFTPNRYSDDAVEQMTALLDKVATNASPFWILEPVSRAHTGVIGELTVSGATTYVLPLDASTVYVLVGGIPDHTTKTIHAAANLLTDAQANGEGGVTTGLDAYGSCAISSVRWPALSGRSSILVDPTGTVANAGVNTNDASDRPTVSPSKKYTVQASFLPTNGTDTFKVEGQYRTAAGATTGTAFSSSSTGTAGAWLHLRASATGAADAATLEIRAYRTTSSATNYHVACLGVAPGDCGRWFLPSLAPRLVEFGTAPTAEQRLSFAAASCQRWARVVMTENHHGATMELLGDSTQSALSLSEVVFKRGE